MIKTATSLKVGDLVTYRPSMLVNAWEWVPVTRVTTHGNRVFVTTQSHEFALYSWQSIITK